MKQRGVPIVKTSVGWLYRFQNGNVGYMSGVANIKRWCELHVPNDSIQIFPEFTRHTTEEERIEFMLLCLKQP